MGRNTSLSTTAKIGIGVGSGLVVLLGGGYLAGPAPDPVFSFERPPKPFIA